MTIHDMTKRDARCALTRYEVVLVKGGTSGKLSPVFRVFGQRNRSGKVACARDVWRTNGVRIQNCLVVLSNFHVQSIFIRVTV